MASTRTRNTPGDYAQEQQSLQRFADYGLERAFGARADTHLPGRGLLPAKIPAAQLVRDACDLESFLFGIGSSNLHNPSVSRDRERAQQAAQQPHNRKARLALNICAAPRALLLPPPLAPLPVQRPYFSDP